MLGIPACDFLSSVHLLTFTNTVCRIVSPPVSAMPVGRKLDSRRDWLTRNVNLYCAIMTAVIYKHHSSSRQKSLTSIPFDQKPSFQREAEKAQKKLLAFTLKFFKYHAYLLEGIFFPRHLRLSADSCSRGPKHLLHSRCQAEAGEECFGIQSPLIPSAWKRVFLSQRSSTGKWQNGDVWTRNTLSSVK